MKLKPLYPMILIAPDPVEEKLASGIVLPDYSQEPKNSGTVKYLPEQVAKETDLKSGDRVLWKKYSESAIEVDNELLLDFNELLCKLPPKSQLLSTKAK